MTLTCPGISSAMPGLQPAVDPSPTTLRTPAPSLEITA